MGWLNAPIDDIFNSLPKGPAFRTRSARDVKGVVAHHTGSFATASAVARYHVFDRKWPTVGYHFWIEPSGEVLQLNPITVVANSQGGANSLPPVPFLAANQNFVSVAFRGDFSNEEPTVAAQVAFRWLWAALQDELGVYRDMLFCHNEFKSTLCPGSVADLVEDILGGGPLARDVMPKGAREAQRILVDLGFDLGKYGPERDGVDGVWGRLTGEALQKLTGYAALNFESSYALAEKWSAGGPGF